MSRAIINLISVKRQQLAALAAGLVAFVLLCLGLANLGLHIADTAIDRESRQLLQPLVDRSRNMVSVFASLQTEMTAAPCSPQFVEEMRRISLRPDGLHEFAYVRGGEVLCSVSAGRLTRPVRLEDPDTTLPGKDIATDLWMDLDLGEFGFAGVSGTIVKRGSFAIAYPRPNDPAPSLPWLNAEWGLKDATGRFWHRGGAEGLYEATAGLPAWDLLSLVPAIHASVCDEEAGNLCVVAAAPLAALAAEGWPFLAIGLVLATLAALGIAGQTRDALARRWSFRSRFLRTLGPDTVFCLYQPIVSLATGEVEACEVLARWRDVDGSIVAPGNFIPIVEKSGLTLEFTRMVVERAYRELSASDLDGPPIYVTFNVFPCDLPKPGLAAIFAPFAGQPERFVAVAELVESEEIDAAAMQAQIDDLRAAGIKVLIDDFGSGYSNIKNLADISVDGVKIDRGFAMAPDGTVAAKMLDLAIEMIETAGRTIVVEGIETEERLQQLRRNHPSVGYVQGFHLSRPIDIASFVRFRRQAVPAGHARRRGEHPVVSLAEVRARGAMTAALPAS
ncbi:EAL domain-containing protein [Jiella sonneratiae]|uniref:cyclic-guanylate-specific phosphodiesterase n=1 Tax=Jiella sonneratiae TaxID=2816856 RepID=A0ABS3J9B1_9HYPH|nr:EAL domain-containing protein [Jiella sonneratiae]MBO0905707.1 EAL domain-containing protein [Jiella sonneratiae]